MGVPAFFRWLTRKYPSIIVHCIEQKNVDVDGVNIPIDASEPNPNGVEFDNLYLDMNGIIHPCTHPEDKPAPKNEEEMMLAIFECIDRLFRIVRPRKVLYMALDGVAPRAKMNQQRSRRFRASKESYEKVIEISKVRAELLVKGVLLPPEKSKEEHFDSNCITPGTPFMMRLSDCLHYYIHDRLNNDPGWRGVKVIFSDASVPGEGEHKIMQYIRKQRSHRNHDPNTMHCLCGADADLIMLGLATHEPNFTIIREELKRNGPKPCDICGQPGHQMSQCFGLEAADVDAPPVYSSETDFIFVRLNVLREYLFKELQMPNLPFKYDFERAIDDWVFMCFFVGNDFLPHLPSLDISEGAINRLVNLYKDTVYKTKGWITNSGDVDLESVQLIMVELGKVEDEIFRRRQENKLRQNQERKRRAEMQRSDDRTHRPNWSLVRGTQFEPTKIGNQKTLENVRNEAFEMRKAGMHWASGGSEPVSNVKKKFQNLLESTAEQSASGSSDNGQQEMQQQQNKGVKRPADDYDSDDQSHDEVRLWESGFKDRYYESKFDVKSDNLEFRYNVALHYVRGLCWVLRYYYQGCASWKWYFPYHYAPFASDFVNIAGLSTQFELGTKPFNPLEQLMGVFPAASSSHVPEAWAPLMKDPESPIIDLYPEDFKIDLNGKKFAWQGVALLPFIDEDRLKKTLGKHYDELTDDEMRRNTLGEDKLYLGPHNEGYELLKGLYDQDVDSEQEVTICVEGMKGVISVADEYVSIGGSLKSPLLSLSKLTGNKACCVVFRDPYYPEGFVFPAIRLQGAKTPARVLKPGDLEGQGGKRWYPQIGMAPATQRAFIGNAGHRFLNHHVPQGGGPRQPGGGGNNQYDRYRGNNDNRGGKYGDYRSSGGSGGGGNYRGGFGGPSRGYQSGNSGGRGGGYHHQQQQQHRGGGGGGGYNSGGGGYRSQPYIPRGGRGGNNNNRWYSSVGGYQRR